MFVLAINVAQGTFWDQKRLWFIVRKFFWFKIIWVCFGKIDFRGLFGVRILSLNLGVQSKMTHKEKHGIFQKFKKVVINKLYFQLCCLKINCYHFIITVLDMMFVLWIIPYKGFKKLAKIQTKIKKFNMVNLFSITYRATTFLRDMITNNEPVSYTHLTLPTTPYV